LDEIHPKLDEIESLTLKLGRKLAISIQIGGNLDEIYPKLGENGGHLDEIG